jgi:transposase
MQSSITMSKETKRRNPLQKDVEFLKYSVGTDMSKAKFDACISVIDTSHLVKVIATRSFRNTPSDIEEFYRWSLSKIKYELPVVYTMEATGVYYEKLAWFLNKNDCYVSVVLPNRSKKYMQSVGIKTKNDRIDSKGLARMGAEQRLGKWEAPDEKIVRLRNLTRHREGLQATKTRINNQLEAFQCSEHVDESVVRQQKEIMEVIDEKIKETEKLIIKLVRNDPELMEKVQKITKIKGIGILTLATLIAETNAFNLIKNQSQLVSYAGYDVIENQSGKHVGKTKISKKGNSHIRRILYMPALTAVSNNEPIFKNLYERIYGRTKVKMKGYVAVQRKLLVLVYALWKNNEEFERDYLIKKQKDEYPEMQSRSSSFRLAS